MRLLFRRVLLGAAVAALPATAARAALLTVSVNTTPPSPADLTAEGPVDWSIWATTATGTVATKGPTISKSGGAGLFSVLSPATTGTVRGGGTTTQGFSWSDGTPTVTGSNDATLGLLFDSTLDTVGEGVQFTITGSTATERQAKIWASGFGGQGTLTASLNGATDVVLLSQTYGGGSKVPTLFTVNFRPDAPGDLLTIKYVLSTDSAATNSSHVGIQAAAVANVPEPAAGAVILALGGLLAARRRRAR